MSLGFDMSRKTGDNLVLERRVPIEIKGKIYVYFMTNCWFAIAEKLKEFACGVPSEKYFQENKFLAKAVREKMAALGATWSLTVSNGASVLNYYDATTDTAYITSLEKLRHYDDFEHSYVTPSLFIRFVTSVMANNTDEINKFLAMGVNVDIFNERNITPLMIASTSNSYGSVKTLLEHGADINAYDLNGQTPLMYTTFNDSSDAAKALLFCKNINLEAKDLTDSTALYKAVAYGSVAVVRLLIEHGANIDVVNCFGETPLVRSIINKNYEIAALLIDSGANVNLLDSKKRTPLFVAATYNFVLIAEKLISAGATHDVLDAMGDSALIAAVEKDSADVVEMFLKSDLYSEKEIEKAVIRSSLKGWCNTTCVLLENSGKNQKQNTFAALIVNAGEIFPEFAGFRFPLLDKKIY